MTQRADMLGRKFGNIRVIAATTERGGDKHIVYLCECLGHKPPKVLYVQGNNLRNGHTTSCGCKRTIRRRSRPIRLEISP